MAYIRCDVASSGPYRYQQIGEMFPRVDVSPGGGWVSVDCNPDGSVYVKTSAGVRMELGPRQPNNPACPRFQTDQYFHVYMVAWSGTAIYGRHLVFDAAGNFYAERPNFDASQGQAMGILDVTVDGMILWWNGHSSRVVDGLLLLNPRERGDYIAGVLADAWLGVSVFEKSTDRWFRAWPYDTQLLPGIADDGTVAAQGEGGGFISRADWLTRPFDPHVVVEPDVAPTITTQPQSVTVTQGQTATFAVVATGTVPLHYQWAVGGVSGPPGLDAPTFTTPPLEQSAEVWVTVSNVAGTVTSDHARATVTVDPIDPIDPIDPPDPGEPKMNRCTVLVDDIWWEVEEMPHPDAGPEHGPVVGVKRVSDGFMLKVRSDGNAEFEAGTPGADERLIPVPGAYVALREATTVIDKAGPWTM